MSVRRHHWFARFTARTLVLAALFTTASFVPLASVASAKLEQKDILLEANNAATGFDRTVQLGIGAEMVGFTWTGKTSASVDVRGLIGSTWTDWVTLDGEASEGPDTASKEHHLQVAAGPTWLGRNATSVEVKVTKGLAHGLTLHAINTENATTSSVGVKPAGATTPLPFITTRAQWGADESLRGDGPEYASSVKMAVVHHTVNSNSYGPQDSAALVRGIYLFHTRSNGWSDIGYNFLIDRFGQVFEGRYGGINEPVIGAHAGGFNGGSTGIALIGSFDTSGVPDATYQSLRKLLDWKLAYHHINPLGTTDHTVAASDCNCQNYPVGSTVTLPTITGHRDLDATGCPGQYMYDLLPQLRNDVAMDIGNQGPAEWTCQWDINNDYGPGAVAVSATRSDVYVRGDDGELWQRVRSAGVSSPWSPLGGYLTSDPDAASPGDGKLDIVARGGDGALWLRVFNGLTWRPWQSLGGQLSSAPSVVAWGSDRLSVFACGHDGALWTRTFDGSWGPWQSLGGFLFAAPDASSDGDGRIDVVVRGVGGVLYRRSFRNGAWQDWDSAGGAMASGGGSASWATNREDVVIRGLDGALWANAWTGSGWAGWYSLGGIITSDPDITSPEANNLIINARGADGAYWQRAWDGKAWTPWRQA